MKQIHLNREERQFMTEVHGDLCNCQDYVGIMPTVETLKHIRTRLIDDGYVDRVSIRRLARLIQKSANYEIDSALSMLAFAVKASQK